MIKGDLALVLHAHLPYVRSAQSGSLEEDWFFQALLESYLPLLRVLEEAGADPNQRPKITIGISPTLLSLLSDKQLKKRFPNWLALRLDLLKIVPSQQSLAANSLAEVIKQQLDLWHAIKGDLIGRFAELQRHEVVDLITCAATHGYLPLLRENPEAIRGQLNTAVREHLRLVGVKPLGIWLPECAYYEGLDHLLVEAGLRYAVLDGHGILHAHPRPRYGIYAPICSSSGVAFFGRDGDATLPVWSAETGYPGNPAYREFHRDLGWELPVEKLRDLGLKEPKSIGLKLHRVTNQNSPLEAKALYEPTLAKDLAKKHATHYLRGRRSQLDHLTTSMKVNPLLVAPFDAELFGHWWFEGPTFLAELFLQANHEKVRFTRLRDLLLSEPQLQLCEPCPSSWGKGGYHNYWVNESNSWVIPQWSLASRAMIDICSLEITGNLRVRIIKQAARELLLAQSSDWSFILRAGTTTGLAKERIHRHLDRFWTLIRALNEKEELPSGWLANLEAEDCLFPLIEIKDWSRSVT